jgi:MYXO-CTERM domain-containing protein
VTGSTTGSGDTGQGGASTSSTGTSTTTTSATGGSAGQTSSGNSSNDPGGCACTLRGAARARGGFAALLALLALGRRRRARVA